MKITVKVFDLLAGAEQALKGLIDEEEGRDRQHEKALEKWAKEIGRTMRALADRIDKVGFIALTEEVPDEDRDWNLSQGLIKIGPKYPEKKTRYSGLYRSNVERDIAALKSTPKETLNVGPDDHLWKYLARPDDTR